MESLFTPGEHYSSAILAILIMVIIKVLVFHSARTKFWTFSQFFFFSLKNIELTEGRRYVIKLVNNALTCSIILIVFSYFLSFYLDITSVTPANTTVAEVSFEPIIESSPEIFNSIQINNTEDNATVRKPFKTDQLKRLASTNMEGLKTMSNNGEKTSNRDAVKGTQLTAIETPSVEPNYVADEKRKKEKINRRIVKAISRRRLFINKRNFSSTEMFFILDLLKEKRKRLSIHSNCVRIIKSKTSNIENAFRLAQFFQKQGFVIAGREERFIEETGIRIDVEGIILKIIIGRN